MNFVLRLYLRKCQEKHGIAFLEWRRHFCQSRLQNDDEVQMFNVDIEERIDNDVERMQE